MAYTFKNHLHNYACWTAARAVQRNFTTTQNIVKAIESSDLIRIEEINIQSAQDYDSFHRSCCNQLIQCFETNKIAASYGRAAKIVAIYLKTSVIVRYSGEGTLSKLAHPPIDRILLTNLHKRYPTLGVGKTNWTELKEESYFELIAKLRTLPFNKFWELEAFWNIS